MTNFNRATIISVAALAIAAASIVLSLSSMHRRDVNEQSEPALSEEQASSEESMVSPDFTPDAVVSYRATMEGTYVACLPVHDNFSDQTCRQGMKLDDGSYYAVTFATMSQQMDPLENGQRFSATGLVTPIEMPSSDRWQGTIAKGIFSVTDSVQRL